MAFDIKDFFNEESKKEVADNFKIKKISVKKLHPSEQNFYNVDPKEIEALKDTIELVGVQENLVVKEITEGEFAGEYEIISGHKRHLAVSELAAEGKVAEFVPCKIDRSGNNALREMILIFTNSTQRERSDFEKMKEIQRVRELLTDYAKENDLPGRKRDIIAGILNTSKSTVSRLDNIRRHMIPEFMAEYKAGKLPTATANEIAGVSDEGQKELWQQYKKTGSIRKKEAAEAKREERPEKMEDTPELVRTKEQEEKQEQPEELRKRQEKAETDEPDMTKEEMEKLYHAMGIGPTDSITAAWLKDRHGKTRHGGVYEGLIFSCTTRGARAGRSREMTWGEIAEAFVELRKKRALEGPEAEHRESGERLDVGIKAEFAFNRMETVKELGRLLKWMTAKELKVIQDVIMILKEREGQSK